jgi:hypothetical protein
MTQFARFYFFPATPIAILGDALGRFKHRPFHYIVEDFLRLDSVVSRILCIRKECHYCGNCT